MRNLWLCMAVALVGCKSSSPATGDDLSGELDMALAANADLSYPPGSGTATGTVPGMMLDVKDAYSYDESSLTGGQGVRLAIKLTDFTSACGLQQQNDSHKASSQYLKLAVTLQGGTDIPAGTYMIGSFPNATPPQLNSGEWKTNNASCVAGVLTAASGTITFTKNATGVTGTYDLTFASGTLMGSFTAPTCTIPKGGTQICAP